MHFTSFWSLWWFTEISGAMFHGSLQIDRSQRQTRNSTTLQGYKKTVVVFYCSKTHCFAPIACQHTAVMSGWRTHSCGKRSGNTVSHIKLCINIHCKLFVLRQPLRKTIEALSRNNLFSFVQRCAPSSNIPISLLLMSDVFKCLYFYPVFHTSEWKTVTTLFSVFVRLRVQ